MSNYVLVCDCGSEDFDYYSDKGCFICANCGSTLSEDDAGHNLIED